MALNPGTRLGAYEIVALLGAGGMGEVYRARDTRLKREVAIKILPDAFANDADRLSRFQREAELLATLNHPNIGAVFGLEQSHPSTSSGQAAFAIVLELIEGDTLADRLKHGAIPLKEALEIALQIAEALEAAHEKAIIHRDLKPANIKITNDGKVKVLDFGLAKAMESSPVNAALSHSPTLSFMATQAGMVLGTAAYMAPEQAKGSPADQRSDVFAFGVVLYEMITGRQPFQGDTAPEVLASVLIGNPDLNILPPNLNPRLTELLRRCLEKLPKKRWQAIGDVRAEVETIAAAPHSLSVAPPTAQPRSLWRRVAPMLAMAVGTATIIAAIGFYAWPASAPATVARFSIPLAEDQQFTNTGRQVVAISPDGTRIVYVANQTLFLRSMSELRAKPIAGTETKAGGVFSPAFSPDGQSIVFWSGADQTLKRIAVSGGAAVTICPADTPYGITWGEDGIVYGQGNKGIMRVAASGGNPEMLVAVEGGEIFYGPQILPGAKAVLFTLAPGIGSDRWDTARLVVQSLQSNERKTLVEGASDGRYLPNGQVIYALGGTLFAVPFDLQRLSVTGGPTPVLEGVRRGGTTGVAQFSFSRTGSLLYIPGPSSASGTQRDLALLDRKGGVEPLKLPSGAYGYPRVSPDGKRLAFASDDGKEEIVWVYELSGATSIRRLTFGGRNRFPAWSADSQRVAFQSDREGDLGIFWQRADGSGSAERLTKPEQGTSHIPESWSRSGEAFLFTATKDLNVTLWTFSQKDRKAVPFATVQSSRQPISPVFSPDDHWVAYTSTETGRAEVFVQPFPATGEKKYQISKNGGHHPLWTPDGRELLYDVTAGRSEIVKIVTKPTFTSGNPAVLPRGSMLFASEGSIRPVDMAPDGRIVGAIEFGGQTGTSVPPEIDVVLNWFEELKQRVPAK